MGEDGAGGDSVGGRDLGGLLAFLIELVQEGVRCVEEMLWVQFDRLDEEAGEESADGAPRDDGRGGREESEQFHRLLPELERGERFELERAQLVEQLQMRHPFPADVSAAERTTSSFEIRALPFAFARSSSLRVASEWRSSSRGMTACSVRSESCRSRAATLDIDPFRSRRTKPTVQQLPAFSRTGQLPPSLLKSNESLKALSAQSSALSALESTLDWNYSRLHTQLSELVTGNRVAPLQRSLRIHLTHKPIQQPWQQIGKELETPNFTTNEGVPRWELTINGHIVHDETKNEPKVVGNFTKFIKRIVIESDRDSTLYGGVTTINVRCAILSSSRSVADSFLCFVANHQSISGYDRKQRFPSARKDSHSPFPRPLPLSSAYPSISITLQSATPSVPKSQVCWI